jgi:hypothetical protein
MSTVKTRHALMGAVAGAACAALALSVVPAHAAAPTSAASAFQAAPKVRLPAPQNLQAVFTKPGAAYSATFTWNAVAAATGYKMSLSSGGTTVTGKSTGPSWTTPVTADATTQVTLRVQAVAGKQSSKPATRTFALPDLDAPTGAFTLAFDSATLTARVTESHVSDNVTPAAAVVREIDWGAGAGFQAFGSGQHTYGSETKAYHPRVRLTDTATPANSVVIALPAVVVNDGEAPSGAFTVAPGTAWATYTPVTLSQTAIHDNVSADADIQRVVDWGDGTTTPWSTGMTVGHVYTVAGSFAPVVQLTDEAGRVATGAITGGPVTVTADTTAPKTSLTRPKKAVRSSVAAWVRLHGRASDTAGSGVKNVKVRIVEKRGDSWFGYVAATRTWRKAATLAGALEKSRPATVRPVDGAWRYRIGGLRKGTLLVKVSARDNVGNASKAVTYKQVLARR